MTFFNTPLLTPVEVPIMRNVIAGDCEKLAIMHHMDLDGHCAAAIIGQWCTDNQIKPIYVPIDYGNELEALEQVKDIRDVVLVDFSLPVGDLEMLYAAKRSFVWIDHHKTSKDLAEHINGVRCVDSGLAACALSWYMCYPSVYMPYYVRLLSEYDVWNHSDAYTLPFQYGMRSVPNEPGQSIWTKLYKAYIGWNGSPMPDKIRSYLEKGWAILEYNKQQYSTMMSKGAFEQVFHGLNFIACFVGAGSSSSQMFKSVYDPMDSHDGMMSIRYEHGNWVVSLYTTHTDKLDMGDICKHHGGGGHPGAAGFTVKGSQNIIDYLNLYSTEMI